MVEGDLLNYNIVLLLYYTFIIFAIMESKKYKNNKVTVMVQFTISDYERIKELALANNRSLKNYIETLVMNGKG